MKRIILIAFVLAFWSVLAQGQVAINTDGSEPHSAAMLDIKSTEKGILIPRMTSAERNAIGISTSGLLVYDLDTESFWYFNNTLSQWLEIGNGSSESLNDLSDVTNVGSKLFMGTDAGLNNIGAYNTGIGYEAMKSNTSGIYNTALGYKTLNANNLGGGNSAFGHGGLMANTSGDYNVAMGSSSLNSNTSGSNNTGIGTGALFHNTTGGGNTAIGSNAGEGQEGGNFWGCVFLGYHAGQNNTSNNKLFIDNSNTATPLIGGDFADNRLEINGTIKISGGNPGLGKVLTSNADGLASWESPDAGVSSINDLSDATVTGSSFFMGTDAGINNTGSYNFGIGHEALKANTTGTHNTALGFKSMTANTSGSNNSAFGHASLISNTSGHNNVATGKSAMFNNTSGHSNIAIGTEALLDNLTGDENVAIGLKSLYLNTNRSNLVAIGFQALYHNGSGASGGIEGFHNTAIGSNAAYSNTTGYAITAIGESAAQANTSGHENVAIGARSLYSNTTGNELVTIGAQAMYNNTTGEENTALGAAALWSNIDGEGNTAVGRYSGYGNTSGSYNTAIGRNALAQNSTGNGNTALGYNAFNNGIYSNSIAIGYNTTITDNNQVRIGNSGITSIGGQVGWSTLSDGRFKSNINEDVSGLDFIMKLRPVNYQVDREAIYDYTGSKAPEYGNKTRFSETESGFIAQEVEQAAQDLGFAFSGIDAPDNEKDYYSLRYGQFVVPLVKAVQEQQREIELLREEVRLLKELLDNKKQQ